MNDYYPSGTFELPDERDLVDYDYEGKELYRGDEVYDTSSGFVLIDEIEEYMVNKYGRPIEMEWRNDVSRLPKHHSNVD